MSKTIKRNVLIVLFAVVATFSLAFSFVFKNAKAEESPSTVSTAIGQAEGVVMLHGASARMTSNDTYSDGLRAIVTVTSDVYSKLAALDSTTTLQVWFTTAQNFETAQTASVELLKANSKVCDFNVKDLYSVNNLYYGNAVLTNLSKENQQDYQFVAIGVLATTTDGTTTYTLGGFADNEVKNNTRSLYERVNAAFLNSDAECNAILSNSTYASWYGTTTHPIVINSQVDYDNLITRAKTIDLSSLSAIKKASDTFTGEFGDRTKAPTVVDTVTVTVKANGTTTEINVPKDSDITSTLNGLVPADTEDKYFDSWSVEGKGDITNVTSDIIVNAVMNDYLTITVVDKYNTENENATIQTIEKVKEGDLLSDYITKSTFATAMQPEGASHKGYIVTPNGSEASKVSSLDNLEVTANTTISLWMATLQNVQVNVKVEAYKTSTSMPKIGTNFPGWSKVGASTLAGEHTYEDKSSEFTDLPQVTGYEDEKIDLSAFMAKLPKQYTLNTTAELNGDVTIDGSTYATNKAIVEGDNSIDIYLDANTEVLGFSLTDIYIGAGFAHYDEPSSHSDKITLTRRSNGDVGVEVFLDASGKNVYCSGIGVNLRSDVTKQNYSSVKVNYAYKATQYTYLNAIGVGAVGDNIGKGATSATYGIETDDYLDASGDLMTSSAPFDQFTDAIFTCPSAGYNVNETIFLKSIKYSAKATVSTETNTTMDATELKKYVRTLSDAGTFSIVEDGEKTALRYTATENEPTYLGGWGIGFYFNEIDITKFESIKVTFKMSKDYARNIRFDLNGGSVGTNFTPTVAQGKIFTLDVLNLPGYEGTGKLESDGYKTLIKNGTPITSIILSTRYAHATDNDGNKSDGGGFTIDVYSIEFVLKTAAETPQA